MPTSFDRTESLLTVDLLKERYLHGVDLTDDDGVEIPKEAFEHSILSAISHLEHQLDLRITPFKVTEKRDFNRSDYLNWGYLRLYQYPIISLDAWKAQYPLNTDLIDYPSDWFRLYKETGEVQLVPTAGTLSTFFLPAGGILPYVLGKAAIPQFFQIEYTAGFEEDKIPILINSVIGLLASIHIFNITGDLIAGAGIASFSLGLDGLSQSVGTTSSATNSGYGARIIMYEKMIKSGMENLHKFYKGIQMSVS